MTCVMRKPDFSLRENKGADQLHSNCEADQCLCFHYLDSTVPLLLKSEISSFLPSSVTVQAGLCCTWSETPKLRFSRITAHITVVSIISLYNIIMVDTMFTLSFENNTINHNL